MFCRHCGKQYVTDEAVLCVQCMTEKGKSANFCPSCGQPTPYGMVICQHCGVDCTKYGIKGEKSKLVAGLLAIFLGVYGVHNFYLGKIKRAVTQLCLCVGGFILYFIGLMVFTVLSSTSSVSVGLVFLILGILGVLCPVAVAIWALVEGVMILMGKINTDGAGKPLKD